ncbi:MAG: DUF896 domain-containing protein [Bacteroides sp.]|nr:DUF896 domain-containing protein [Bacteroides sp.]
MEKSKIQRINFLAAKARNEGLTDLEKAEQQILRDEYREGFRKNLTSQLENTYIADKQGNKIKLNRKGEAK